MPLRPKSFWTPLYIRNRLLLAYEQKRQPSVPWWPKDARRHLEDMLLPTDICLEWGSGRSTAWLSKRCRVVHSIEHDQHWFETVRSQLTSRGSDPELLRLLSTAPAEDPVRSPYVRAIDDFADGEISVVVVDGEYRDHCALAAVPKLASGGLLLVDDASWFLDHPTTAPHSRDGKGALNAEWEKFHHAVAKWRCVWTTDGVTDTAIWIKP